MHMIPGLRTATSRSVASSRVASSLVLCVLVLGVAACGGSSDGAPARSTATTSGTPSGETAATTNATAPATHYTPYVKPFPKLTISTIAPDYVDPALGFTFESWQLAWNTWLPLVTYAHQPTGEDTQLIPALAQSIPNGGFDGKTYQFKLRDGIRFSNGEPVTASDVKATFERLFRMNSPGQSYYTGITGAPEFAKSKQGGIRGITADDADGTVTMHLSERDGAFLDKLALPFGGIVPRNAPPKDSSRNPLPTTGPYAITSYEPDKQLILKRNRYWKAISGIPNGNPDQIVWIIAGDTQAAANNVLSGAADVDVKGKIAPDQIRRLQQAFPNGIKLQDQGTTDWLFMNTRVKPFDDVDVRRAVNMAIDRDVIARLYGGLAKPTQNIFPPGFAGYEKFEPFKFDLAGAKRLVQQAGAAGTPVKVYTYTDDPQRAIGNYVADQLQRIGLKASVVEIGGDTYYGFVGTPKNQAQIGYRGFAIEYPHPRDMLEGKFTDPRQVGNQDLSMTDIPAVNQRIKELDRKPLTAEVQRQWAAVEHSLIENYVQAAPLDNPLGVYVINQRLDPKCWYYDLTYGVDYTAFCIKG